MNMLLQTELVCLSWAEKHNGLVSTFSECESEKKKNTAARDLFSVPVNGLNKF